MLYQSLLRPLLFRMDAERSHNLVLEAGKLIERHKLLQNITASFFQYRDDHLSQNLWGTEFPNPIGLAAGFDKNGQLLHTAESLGFGFIEVGSITAEAHPGNKKPRMFRITDDQSLINRMGLNNDGAETIIKRLSQQKRHIPLGINIAKTNNSTITGDQAIKDYRFSYEHARNMADYITINISCPNTGKGRTFEDPTALDELLDALQTRNEAGTINPLVKFSVDLSVPQMEKLVDICEHHRIKGYVIGNTSSKRRGLKSSPSRLEEIGSGGLSGRAIARRSTSMIRSLYEMIEGRKPIIGVGGIDSFEEAIKKLSAGANLLQIYTGLVYKGPGLVKQINKQLSEYLVQDQLQSIRQIPHS